MKLCVYTVHVGSNPETLSINREWAISAGFDFFAFDVQTLNQTWYHPTWEKVVRGRELMRTQDHCEMLMWIDADAVVNNPYFPITSLLKLYPNKTFIGACNSPTGNGFSCDDVCCHVSQKSMCVNFHDLGPYSPYPCLMNAGVFFVRNTKKGLKFMNMWLKRRRLQALLRDPY